MATSHSLNPGAKIQHEPDAGMNAQNLLLHFDRISDTPDAVSHLRRFVLDLAVRGKLVPQDPGDEPASELVKELARKKARLLNGGKLTNKKEILEGSPVQMLRTAPSTWTRTRLGDVSNVVMGQSPPGETYNTRGDGVPLINGPVEFSEGPFGITVKNQYTTAPTNFCGKGDLLICVRGSTTGRSNVAGFDACIGRGVAAIQPLFDDGFVRLFLWSMRDELIGMGRGIAFPSITRKQLENFPISLPPLAEQHRIVAKVDELMALCDRLEAARTERETDRNRLAAASLARLNAPDPDPAVFRKDAAFTLGNLTPLATRPDQIKALRQTILNLAVRGKLVPQDPNDKPTRELPKRMALMKAELLTDGKFKTLNVDLPRDDASFPFSLPESWIWCYMDDVGAVARGGSPRPIKSYLTDDPAGIPWIKIGDSVRGNIYIENTKERIRAEGLVKSRLVVPGDLLLSNSMSFGYPYITNIKGCIHDGWLVIRTHDALLDKLFLHTVFLSDHARTAFSEAASGTVVQNLNADKVRMLSIPFPPLAEQHRIVAKVDELMALCDRLEASFAEADDTRRRLLETTLRDALEMTAGGERGHV